MKHTRGPLPSSCLTCRQHKRKCDKTRPACEACRQGGITCLGYTHIPSNQSLAKHIGSIRNIAPKPPQLTSQHVAKVSEIAPFAAPQPSQLFQPTTSDDIEIPLRVPHEREKLRPSLCSPPTSYPKLITTNGDSLQLIDLRQTSRGPPALGKDTLEQPLRQASGASEGCMSSTFFDLPPTICSDPVQSGKILGFILAQYEPLLEFFFFKPSRLGLDFAKKRLVLRLHSSAWSRWSMYIGARIFQVLLSDGRRADLRYLQSCLRQLDQHLRLKQTCESNVDRLASSLAGGLELIFLDFMTSNMSAGYALLKNLVPAFIQVAFSDANIWPHNWQGDPMHMSIPLAHALASPNSDISRFAYFDTMTSLTFGVSPLVEYDTSCPLIRHSEFEFELKRVDGAPPEFTCLFAKINAWRATSPGKSAPEDVWKSVEAEAQASEWRSKGGNTATGWDIVAKTAIFEGWKHAVLIYLYMGMCGVASDDQRVQSSVRQIMKLFAMLGGDISAKTHFFVPSLVASICTPSEKHRASLSKAFLQPSRPWFFKAMDYQPIIDHLWHGAGANGRPVQWQDFINSRRKVLPID